jgi:superfamily II DNA or RNA helicase
MMDHILSDKIVEEITKNFLDLFISKISEKYSIEKEDIYRVFNNEKDLIKKREKKDFTPTPLILRHYQVGCVESVLALWEQGIPAVISSDPGSGKTYMATKLAEIWRADFIVVLAPKTSLTKWIMVLGYILPPEKFHVSTYDAWAKCGTRMQIKSKQPFTYRVENTINDIRVIDFYPTQKWTEMIATQRVIMVLDEFHKLQKPSQRTMAAAANSIPLIKEKNSRLLALSWTPCDKLEDIPMHLYLFGMIGTNKLVYYDRTIELYNIDGLSNVASLAESFGVDLSEKRHDIEAIQFMSGRSVIRKANEIAGEIFLSHIRPSMVFTCKPDFVLNQELKPEYVNYFCRVNKQTEEEIFSIVSESFGGNGDHEEITAIEGNRASMAILTWIQKNLEKIKIPLYVKVAKEWLEKDSTNKVAIMVLYLDTIGYAYTKLEKYGVKIIQGSMNSRERDVSISAFQKEDSNCRVIIATLPTGGESIDLHDISVGGRFKRMILIPPTFYCKSMVQAAGRIFRDGVTSSGIIRILYTTSESVKFDVENDELNLEKRFYDGVRKKTNTIKRYHADNQDSILPCSYKMEVSEKIYKGLVGLEKITDYNKIVKKGL